MVVRPGLRPNDAGGVSIPLAAPSAARVGLRQLLGESTLDGFFENVWERTPQISRGAVEGSLAGILTQDQFETLMAAVPSGTAGWLSIIDGRVARPVIGDEADPTRLPAIYGAYRRGCSLLQSGLQLRWPPIAGICREIENELISRGIPLTEAVGANAYLTPAHSQGFDIHYDNHCALILQLHGGKSWTVFPPPEELPIARCERAIPRDRLRAPVVEMDLVAGDVLYIPRGFPHFAGTSGESSLHLTLSLRTMTWVEVVDALCRASPAFRRSVGPVTGPSPAHKHFESELSVRLGRLDAGGFLERRLAECLARLSPAPSGRLRSIDEAANIGSDTLVLRAPQVICAVSEEDGQAVLRFPGATLRLDVAMKPAFEFIAGNEEFTASDLPQIDATYDAVELTRILIQQGLVRPQTAGESGDGRRLRRPAMEEA